MWSFFKLGSSLPGSLSPADFMSRVFALACQYAMIQHILFALCNPSNTPGASASVNLKGVVDELTLHLDKSFQLTKDQKVSLNFFSCSWMWLMSLFLIGQHSTSLSRANLQAQSDSFQGAPCWCSGMFPKPSASDSLFIALRFRKSFVKIQRIMTYRTSLESGNLPMRAKLHQKRRGLHQVYAMSSVQR